MSDQNRNAAPEPGIEEVDPYEGKPRDYMGFIQIENLEDEDMIAIEGGEEEKDEPHEEPSKGNYPAEQWKEWGSGGAH